jgi:hypothetical protein
MRMKSFTVQLPEEFVEEMNETVFLTGGVTMRSFAYEALSNGLKRLTKEPELFRVKRDKRDLDGI